MSGGVKTGANHRAPLALDLQIAGFVGEHKGSWLECGRIVTTTEGEAMCEFCGTGGACICCGATPEAAGTRFRPGLPDRVALLRLELLRLAEETRAIEAELMAELSARGSRPGDGSDQLKLFDADRTPSMF